MKIKRIQIELEVVKYLEQIVIQKLVSKPPKIRHIWRAQYT